MQQSTPSAYAPTPPAFSPLAQSNLVPRQRPAPPPTTTGPASVRTTGGSAALQVQDPVIEARRNLALLLGTEPTTAEGGPGGGGGLIDKLEAEIDQVLYCYEQAYEKGTPPADLESMYSTFDTLISILSRSSLGGYIPNTLANPGEITNVDLENATKNVQALFKELQRGKEASEIVRAGLAG